jgi:DNA polymerase-4
MGPYLYIDVDAFFASVEQSINPALAGKPVMVGGLAHERGVVSCPSYEARALGVRTGMSLHDAARLVPHGVFLLGDFHCYQYFSDRFYDILGKYTPQLDRISQDEACLALGGVVAKDDATERLARQLQKEIWQALSLSTSVGVGPSRVAAKIASEYKKPMGLTILAGENLGGFFSQLPIGKIPGVGPHREKILHEMGIRTAGQLAAVPENYLQTIFGLNGLKIAAYSRGEDGLPLRDHKVIRSISRETGFAEDITDQTVLLSHLYYLLERATARLRTLGKHAAGLKIKLCYADFERVEGATRIAPASDNESDIFPLVEMMFRRLFTRQLGIRLVGVSLANLKNHTDNETFLDDRIERQKRLRRGLDAARRKAGFFALTTGRTLSLSERYKRGDTGYELRTPGLSQ